MADAFDMTQLNSLIKGISGTGSSGTSSKTQKQLAELQGKIASQLAAQQSQYQQQLAAQQAAAQLQAQQAHDATTTAAQEAQNQFNQPFQAAQLTGFYDGHQTLAGLQLDRQNDQFFNTLNQTRDQFNQTQQQQNDQYYSGLTQNQQQFMANLNQTGQQFNVTSGQEQQKIDLSREIQNRQASLAELTQQQQNAIAQGQLDLARTIETQKNQMQQELQTFQMAFQTADQSGVMANGQMTEAARAEREKEQLARAQALGYDPATGQLLDASQQWRTSAGLQAAQTAAQLGSQASDYFQSAAYLRDPNVQSNLAFLNASQTGQSMGFRTAANGVPQTASLQSLMGTPTNPAIQANVPGGGDGPSPSLSAAQGALQGNPATFDSQMHQAQAGMPQQPVNYGSVAAYNANATGQPDVAQQRLQAIQQGVIQPGAAKMAPGTMEAMSPTEKGLMASALKASGINPTDFEAQYQRSRLQTGVSALAA